VSLGTELLGFEAGDFTGVFSNGGDAISVNSARSGNYGLHLIPAASDTYGVVVGSTIDVGTRLPFAAYLQFYARFNSYPSADNSMFAGFASGDTVLAMNRNGTLKLTKAGIGNTSQPGKLPLNQWLKFILTTWSPDGVDLNTIMAWSYGANSWSLLANGQYSLVGGTWDSTSLNGAALNTHNFLQGVLGGQTGSGSATTWDVDIDDGIYIVASTLADMNGFDKWLLHDNTGKAIPNSITLGGLTNPTSSLFWYDSIQPIYIITEAPGHTFVPPNNAAVISAVPSAGGRNPLEFGYGGQALYNKQQLALAKESWTVIDNVSGAQTAITVDQTVEAYQLKGNATSVPSGNQQLTLDSLSPVAPTVALSSTTANGNDTSPRTPARMLYGAAAGFYGITLGNMQAISTFNAWQMQLVNLTGALVKLTNLYVEVLVGLGTRIGRVPGQTPTNQVPSESVIAGVPPAAASAEGAIPPTPPHFCVSCKDPDVTYTDSGGGTGCKDPDVTGTDCGAGG
jgi:hypothetical protein